MIECLSCHRMYYTTEDADDCEKEHKNPHLKYKYLDDAKHPEQRKLINA